MSLSSVLNTAHTALSAAEMAMDVIANNMANVQTDGFKASRTVFTSGTYATYGLGSAPNGRSGGTNPVQTGTGVQLAAVGKDFSQGAIALSADPLDMAIEGDGFFILEGPGGEQLFGRSGDFQVNAAGEIVAPTGHRLLGYSVNANFQVDRTRLGLLQLPPGSANPGANLVGVSIDHDGRLRGRFSDGVTRDLGQVALARFNNPQGLEGRAQNLYATGSNSGLPVVGNSNGARITGGARELSNASIDQGLIDLTTASTMFRANLQVFDVVDEIFDELLNLRRK